MPINRRSIPDSCPDSAPRTLREPSDNAAPHAPDSHRNSGSRLAQWPVQLALVPTWAKYFREADLLIAADCVPYAYGRFHDDFLRERPMVVGCPKLDNTNIYIDKLAEIFSLHNLKAVEVLVMEVPCCSGMLQVTSAARQKANVTTPVRVTTIGVRGEHLGTRDIS